MRSSVIHLMASRLVESEVEKVPERVCAVIGPFEQAFHEGGV